MVLTAPRLTLPNGHSIEVPVENFVPIISEELIETILWLLSQDPGDQHFPLNADEVVNALPLLPPSRPVADSGAAPASAPLAPPVQHRPDQKVLSDATDPNSTRHLSTHFPSLPDCKFCQQAKQKQAQARRIKDPKAVDSDAYSQKMMADLLIFGKLGPGIQGEHVCLMLRDVLRKFRWLNPVVKNRQPSLKLQCATLLILT